jgi:subtilisin family serine protease
MKRLKLVLFCGILLSTSVSYKESGSGEVYYYYSYDEKIELTMIRNKVSLKFHSDRSQLDAQLVGIGKSLRWTSDQGALIEFSSEVLLQQFLESPFARKNIKSQGKVYTINHSDSELICEDEIVVKFKKSVAATKVTEIASQFGMDVVEENSLFTLFKVRDAGTALDVANRIQESGLTIYSFPNFVSKIRLDQHIPNDPFFQRQFYLHNTGQVTADNRTGTPDADIDAPEAWEVSQGSSQVIVAVLDDGVSAAHPDIPASRQVRLAGSNPFCGDPNNPEPATYRFHGNACAGIIAAAQDNSEGVAGICSNCKIMPIKISDDGHTPSCAELTPAQIANAIKFAVDNGAWVLSNSWSTLYNAPNIFPVIVDAISYATTQGRGQKGCVVVFSPGNDADHSRNVNGFVNFPASVTVSGVFAVGASDRNDQQANYSPTSDPNSAFNQIVDIVAPSHKADPDLTFFPNETREVWTADSPGNFGINPYPSGEVHPPVTGEQLPSSGTNYLAYTGRFGGTSSAAPQVAGVAALLLSVNPNLTQQQVFDIITSTADKVGGYTYSNGWSKELGYGRLNACKAVVEVLKTGNSITGPVSICSTGTFGLVNSPLNPSIVTWTTSHPYLSINSSGLATRLNNLNGYVTVTATVNAGCTSFALTKVVYVGAPTILDWSIDNMQTSQTQVCPGGHTLRVTPSGFNPNNAAWVVPAGIEKSIGLNNLGVNLRPTMPSSINISASFSNVCGTGPSLTFTLIKRTVGCPQSFSIAISPNPAQDEVSVQLVPSATDGVQLSEEMPFIDEVRLVDNDANVVIQSKRPSKRVDLNVKGLKKGQYHLRVSIQGEIFVEHVLIE